MLFIDFHIIYEDWWTCNKVQDILSGIMLNMIIDYWIYFNKCTENTMVK